VNSITTAILYQPPSQIFLLFDSGHRQIRATKSGPVFSTISTLHEAKQDVS
jgi:hypothetical protein